MGFPVYAFGAGNNAASLPAQPLAPLPAFRYRPATRVDTLGGNAEEGWPGRA